MVMCHSMIQYMGSDFSDGISVARIWMAWYIDGQHCFNTSIVYFI
jgi:hypothetical protein